MENKKSLTAVEWLEQEFIALQNYGINELGLFAKAKALEKEQIKEGYNQGYRDGESDAVDIHFVNMDVSMFANAENYYDETYNKE